MRESFGCVKNTIRLRGGRYFDLADPRPDQFELADIAGSLSKLCRFGGQVPRFYSVAEHCVACALQAERDGADRWVQRAALLHDAAEAFVGDVVKPLKVMLPGYAEVERRVQAVINQKYHVPTGPATAAAVGEIDRAMLIAERRELFGVDGVEWTGERSVRRLDVRLMCWPPEDAERAFLHVAARLGVTDGEGDHR